jgi:hypothetical protein
VVPSAAQSRNAPDGAAYPTELTRAGSRIPPAHAVRGDNGAGAGASHRTGWTGLVAWMLMSRAILNPKEALEKGFDAVALRVS